MRMLRSVLCWPPAASWVTVRSLVTVALALSCGAAVGEGKTVRSYTRKNVEPPTRPNLNTFSGEPQVQPTFDNTTNRNVSTQLGKTAYLHCRVKNLGDRTVSWIRHRDLHILTVGRYTYTSDQRFQSIHLERSDDWTLQIKYPQKRDNGTYECQVSTEPKISMFFNLSVVVARATIDGKPDLYMKSGSTINLTCTITQSPHPPTYVFWYHNDKVVTIDSPRGGINVETIKGDITTSKLIIAKAQPFDSGNYTCNPSNANAASINVHVLNGEKPAAMQHGGQSRLSITATSSAAAGLLLLFFTVVPVIL